MDVGASLGMVIVNTNGMPDNKKKLLVHMYEGWNFNSGNYLFTADTK